MAVAEEEVVAEAEAGAEAEAMEAQGVELAPEVAAVAFGRGSLDSPPHPMRSRVEAREIAAADGTRR